MGYYLDLINGKGNKGKKNKELNNNNESFENNSSTVNESDKDLEQIRLVMPTDNGIKKVGNTQKLAVVRQFFNDKANVNLKGQGVKISWPLFNKSYFVDIQRHTVNVKDKNDNNGKSDGRYWQDVGIGDDIGLRLKITFRVKDDEESIQKLLKNETAYLSAIRDAAEQIMRLTIKDKYDPEKENEDIYVDLYEMSLSKGTNKKAQAISDIAAELEQNYGIELEKVKFSDFDKSEEQKRFEKDIKNQEKIRQNELKNAQNRVDVAEKDKEAQIKKNESKIDLYKKLKEEVEVSPNKIGDIELAGNLPKSTVFMYGNSENRPLSSEILAAKKVYDENETETEVEKIKKKEY